MEKLWLHRRLELVVLSAFALITFTSTLILYESYSNYSALVIGQSDQINEYRITMLISASILILSLLIFYTKRDYFFVESRNDIEALTQLLEDIKFSAEKAKINEFKKMLDKQDHQAIYPLIANMINELQESQQLAKDASETKNLFLTNMSHEIRTPLNGIVGFAKLLKSTHLDTEQKEFIQAIQQSSENLIEIVDDIFDLSKIESGSVELELLHFNLINEFESVIENYAIEAKKKLIDFSLWIDPEFATLYVQSDHKKIKQILFNIISNAIKFTPESGKIDVMIQNVKLYESKVSVKFTVKDTGIGIDQQYQDKVFDAFTQVDNSSSRAYGGTGLGLTIAIGLVRLLGGKLELKSKLGEGTALAFTIEMPYKCIKKLEKHKPLKVALYRLKGYEESSASLHLEHYLSSFENISLQYFDSFVACQKAEVGSFDLLYIHSDELTKSEMKRLVAGHGIYAQVVLVTKLRDRDAILDIAPIFSQVLYEPVNYSKVENSLITASKNHSQLDSPIKPLFKGLHALVVEDNSVNRNLIIEILNDLGITTDIAEDGQEAVESFKLKRYDVVFMDIQMPVMNGVVAMQEILRYEKEQYATHTPIIAVTTNNLKGDRERYLNVGMDEYIAKPINANKFIAVLKQFYLTIEESEAVTKKGNCNILLYKERPTESKIIGAILKKLGYSVDIAKNIEDFQQILDKKRYDLILLDRVKSDMIHKSVTEQIRLQPIPSILFITNEIELRTIDIETYQEILDRAVDFNVIKEKLETMISPLDLTPA